MYQEPIEVQEEARLHVLEQGYKLRFAPGEHAADVRFMANINSSETQFGLINQSLNIEGYSADDEETKELVTYFADLWSEVKQNATQQDIDDLFEMHLPDPFAETYRTVEVPTTPNHEGLPFLRTRVTLRWNCPKCGQPRGEIYRTVSYDGHCWMGVDGWVNPCGHVDYYADVLKEAQE